MKNSSKKKKKKRKKQAVGGSCCVADPRHSELAAPSPSPPTAPHGSPAQGARQSPSHQPRLYLGGDGGHQLEEAPLHLGGPAGLGAGPLAGEQQRLGRLGAAALPLDAQHSGRLHGAARGRPGRGRPLAAGSMAPRGARREGAAWGGALVAAARCFEGRRARGWLGTGRRERRVVVSPRSSFLRWVSAVFSPERFAVSLWARPQAVGFPRHKVLRRVGRRFAFRQRRLIVYFSVLSLSLSFKSV